MVSPRIILLATTATVVALTSGCGGAPRSVRHPVAYEVAGSGQAEITYVTSDKAMTTVKDATLPWRQEVSVPAGAYVALVVAANTDSPLMCTVSVDGRLAKREISGEVPVVKCEATVR